MRGGQPGYRCFTIEFSNNMPTSPSAAGGRARPGLEPGWDTTRAGIYVTVTD